MSDEFVDHDSGRDRRSRVVDVRRVTPGIVRVVLAGDDLADYVDNGTDQHVAVLFYDDDVIVPHPLTEELAATMRPFVRPRMRRYTIRRFDPATRRLDLDVAVHGDGGPGVRWALDVRPGDDVWWWGPTSAWRPGPGAARILAVGDETALPAIEAIVREAPAGVPVRVVAEVAHPGDERYLDEVAGRAEIEWIRRRGPLGEASADLLAAVRAATGEPAGLRVWGAGEYVTVQALRRWFHGDRGLDRRAAHLTTYWTHDQPQDLRAERRDAREVAENRRLHPGLARRFLRPAPGDVGGLA